MARRKSSQGSPRITLEITDEARERAVASNSGGCLIADALKAKGYTRPVVDMALIRFSDPERGLRFHYRTPPAAQHLLLSLDQGWPLPEADVKLSRAIHIVTTTRGTTGSKSPAAIKATRVEKVAALEAKEAAGEQLTQYERASLTRMRNPKPTPKRPANAGKATLRGVGGSGVTVVGGRAPVLGPAHPNLLRGRDRHFGAKLADPGVAFNEAVAEGVALELAARETEASETETNDVATD